MFQPTNSTKKDNNLGLPPEPPSLEELADEQEPPEMGAGRDIIVPNFPVLAADEVSVAPVQAGTSSTKLPVLAANEVSATPVQAGASTKLPVLAADDVPTPVQTGVGTEFILEEAAGSSNDQLPVLAADEVSVAPVQAEASTKLPVLAADKVSATPVQAGANTELPVLAADEVSTKRALVPNSF
jgi:hypothetical protein